MPSPFRSMHSMPRSPSSIPASRPSRPHLRLLNQTKYIDDPCDTSHLKRLGRGRDHGYLAEGSSSQAQTPGDGLVENWLAHVQAPRLDSATVSAGVAELLTPHHGRPRQGAGKVAASTDQPARPVARRPPPRQKAPAAPYRGHTCSPLVRSARDDRRRRSKRPAPSDDSSFLSVGEHHVADSADPSPQGRRAYAGDETLQDVRGGLDASEEQASSCMFVAPRSPTFERRPRRKTRPDRYETEKDECRPGDEGDRARRHEPRKRRKEDRKKALLSSKNVVGNFATDAVLKERITVCEAQSRTTKFLD
jgi:hypothetical protein